MADVESIRARIAELERELEELKGSVPAHSALPSHMIRIEELEDEIEELKLKLKEVEREDNGA